MWRLDNWGQGANARNNRERTPLFRNVVGQGQAFQVDLHGVTDNGILANVAKIERSTPALCLEIEYETYNGICRSD